MGISELEYTETKEYKTLIRESGKEYAREFIAKNETELKNSILKYMVDKNKADSEMRATPEFSLAEAAKKKREDILKTELKPFKLKSDLALERIERTAAMLRDEDIDTCFNDSKPHKAAANGLVSGVFLEVCKADDEELKKIVLEYQTENKHRTTVMKAEEKYKEHNETVKLFRSACKEAVKPQKACADMAMEILKKKQGE